MLKIYFGCISLFCLFLLKAFFIILIISRSHPMFHAFHENSAITQDHFFLRELELITNCAERRKKLLNLSIVALLTFYSLIFKSIQNIFM